MDIRRRWTGSLKALGRKAIPVGVAVWCALNTLDAQAAGTTSPPGRRHHALAFDPTAKRVLLYGGQAVISNSATPVLDDLWSFDGQRWTRIAASTGIGMIGHKLFADGSGRVVAIGNPRVAGQFAPPNASPATVMWNGNGWVAVADGVPDRESAGGAFDSRRSRFVLFGGLARNRLAGDTWEFDGERWTSVATSGPPPMLGAAMAFDSRRGVTILFGGIDSTGRKYPDTWEWNGSQWTHVASDGPSARFGAAMAYDIARGEAVLFAGVDSANRKLADTWRWNGRAWTRAQTAITPPVRSEGYMVYDPARGVIVMFGGEGSEVVPSLGDTWEWNGTRWRRPR